MSACTSTFSNLAGKLIGLCRSENTKTKMEQPKELPNSCDLKFFFRFMVCSRHKLASLLPSEKFQMLSNCFQSYRSRQRVASEMFSRFFCFDDFGKLEETKQLLRDQCRDTLGNGKCSVSEAEWQHAKKVYRRFNCSIFEN